LPTGLVLALLISLLWYGGEDVVRRASVMPLNQWLIFTIFFISGLRLQINHLFDEALPLNSFLPVSAVQFLVAPLSALMLGWILQIPEAWFIGLAAICCVPTTLSSGIVLTRQAEGNELLALVLTLVLTLMGTLLTPILFGLLLGTSVAIDLAVGSMILKLCLLVLVPLVLGQLVRKFILRRPPSYLKHLPSICVILTVWLAAQGNSSALRELPWYAWICFALISLSLHICWFGLIWIFAEKNGIHRRNQTAMALIGSQKTLPFAITVLTIALSSGSIADSLPVAISFVVIFHLTQVLTDSLLAPRLAQDPTSHE
jgi:predicted Na+-dependent transporter